MVAVPGAEAEMTVVATYEVGLGCDSRGRAAVVLR